MLLLTGVFYYLKVATISANGEREIGEILARAMEKVGKEGVITVSVSMLFGLHLEAFILEGHWMMKHNI